MVAQPTFAVSYRSRRRALFVHNHKMGRLCIISPLSIAIMHLAGIWNIAFEIYKFQRILFSAFQGKAFHLFLVALFFNGCTLRKAVVYNFVYSEPTWMFTCEAVRITNWNLFELHLQVANIMSSSKYLWITMSSFH